MSKGFVAFKREVLPLCESLPQILHFEKRIMQSLAKHISMQEKESLEPLLDLLTAFAHDLGIRFEKHYPESLGLIVAIAGRPQAVEVIEWTFGALAFLFKYLSKLLVPNLRPTFDAISPLLGKSRHPPHIARFSAEALSFLVKKAGAPSHRETALPDFIRHVKSDLGTMAGERQFSLYQDGIMTMFAEAMKGNENSMHSAAPAIFAQLTDAVFEEAGDGSAIAQNDIWADVVCGVLTSAIHHSTPETFVELQEAILNSVSSGLEQLGQDGVWRRVRPCVRILGTFAGVRKGSHVTDWTSVTRSLVHMLQITASRDEDDVQHDPNSVWRDIMVQAAILWHHAPMDALIPHMTGFSRALTRGPLMRWFIPFCSYLCDLDATRFGNLLRGDFQR